MGLHNGDIPSTVDSIIFLASVLYPRNLNPLGTETIGQRDWLHRKEPVWVRDGWDATTLAYARDFLGRRYYVLYAGPCLYVQKPGDSQVLSLEPQTEHGSASTQISIDNPWGGQPGGSSFCMRFSKGLIY